MYRASAPSRAAAISSAVADSADSMAAVHCSIEPRLNSITSGEFQRRPPRRTGQGHFDDALRSAEGHPQKCRPIAVPDLPARIAFELEGTADPKVAADRQEPMRETFPGW